MPCQLLRRTARRHPRLGHPAAGHRQAAAGLVLDSAESLLLSPEPCRHVVTRGVWAPERGDPSPLVRRDAVYGACVTRDVTHVLPAGALAECDEAVHLVTGEHLDRRVVDAMRRELRGIG